MNAKKHLRIYFILLFSICLMSCADDELTKSANAKSEVIQISKKNFHDQCRSAAYNEIMLMELSARFKSLEARVRALEKNEIPNFKPVSE